MSPSKPSQHRKRLPPALSLKMICPRAAELWAALPREVARLEEECSAVWDPQQVPRLER